MIYSDAAKFKLLEETKIKGTALNNSSLSSFFLSL